MGRVGSGNVVSIKHTFRNCPPVAAPLTDGAKSSRLVRRSAWVPHMSVSNFRHMQKVTLVPGPPRMGHSNVPCTVDLETR